MSTLLDELHRITALVEAAEADIYCPGGDCAEDGCGCGGQAYPERHRDAMIEVFMTLHGTYTSTPWPERREPLSERMPEVEAWCVVKVECANLYGPDRREYRHVWPGMAHATEKQAEAWCDFLSDFYYDTHVRDGKVTWMVEHRPAEIGNLAHQNGTRVGTGYYDRSRWTGTLEMTRWRLDRKRGRWVRLAVKKKVTA